MCKLIDFWTVDELRVLGTGCRSVVSAKDQEIRLNDLLLLKINYFSQTI